MLSDAPLYKMHRSMQVRDTESFLTSIIEKMDWTLQEHDVVMDVGCGPGNSTREMLLPFFPAVKKVVAIDVLADMISFARENNASEKIEYHVADIEKRCSIEKWQQQISKVISVYCFNWLGNQEEGFKNVFYLLKPGGQAALIFTLSAAFWDSYELHTSNPKWKKYLENANPYIPESHFKKYDASYYRCLLENIGFSITICEDENRTYIYPSDDDCRAALYSRCGFTSSIPDELKSEFKEDLFQGFLKYNTRNQDGRPMAFYRVLNLLIQK